MFFLQYGGCDQHQVKAAKHKTQLESIVDRSFIIVLLRRAIDGAEGIEINNDRITSTGDIEVMSMKGGVATFSPVALIEHKGIVNSQGITSGHYTADVKTPNGVWFHTNDHQKPRKIEKRKVTKNAAVVLYCKKSS